MACPVTMRSSSKLARSVGSLVAMRSVPLARETGAHRNLKITFGGSSRNVAASGTASVRSMMGRCRLSEKVRSKSERCTNPSRTRTWSSRSPLRSCSRTASARRSAAKTPDWTNIVPRAIDSGLRGALPEAGAPCTYWQSGDGLREWPILGILPDS